MAFDIRLATDQDAAAITEIYRPIVESTAISFEINPPDEPEMRRRIEETLQTHPWLVCEDGRRLAGYAYASKHRVRAAYQWSVDVSAYVHTEFRRRGIGRRLYTSLFRILAAQGYCNAYAGITLPNSASVGLHEAVGFQPVGVYTNVGFKLGAWHDVGWWQLALQPYTAGPATAPPARLRSLFEIQADPSWPRMLSAGRLGPGEADLNQLA